MGKKSALLCSVAVRDQLEYASVLGYRTETAEKSPEEKLKQRVVQKAKSLQKFLALGLFCLQEMG